MNQTLELEILTPTGALKEASGVHTPGVQLPGAMGELGILADHIPFLTPIVPGVVRFKADGKDFRIAVGNGFVEVSESGKLTVLTERAVQAGDVDVAEVRGRYEELKGELEAEGMKSIESEAYGVLKGEFEWLEAQLRMVG